ncbi:hypothetical protein V502_04644, partial [Pseudogymnoascus sp. VKM F-4520 (FW-2644)]
TSRHDSRASPPTIDTFTPRSRKDRIRTDESSVSSPTTFNAKDAMDLRALREALNNKEKDPSPPPIPPKEPLRDSERERERDRPSRESTDLPPRDATRPRDSDRPSRESTDLPPRDSTRPRDSDRPSREFTDRPSRESTDLSRDPARPTSERFDPRDPRDLASIRAELSRAPAPRERRSSSSHSTERRTATSGPRLVSPPRSSSGKGEDARPVKGILKPGRPKWPEDPTPIREGVAPLKDAKRDGVPADARWTKISRKLVNPEALERGRERYEAREEFVIVLRVLSKEEVQGYATETQSIRAAREAEDEDRDARRRRRKERHERHRSERHHREDRDEGEDYDYERRRHRREREREHESHSESDTSEDERVRRRD